MKWGLESGANSFCHCKLSTHWNWVADTGFWNGEGWYRSLEPIIITSKLIVKVIWRKAASPPHTERSVVFARWTQCASMWTHLSQHSKRHLDRFSRLRRAHRSAYLYFTTGSRFSPQNFPFPWGICTPSNTWLLGHTRVLDRFSRLCSAHGRQTTLLDLYHLWYSRICAEKGR